MQKALAAVGIQGREAVTTKGVHTARFSSDVKACSSSAISEPAPFSLSACLLRKDDGGSVSGLDVFFYQEWDFKMGHLGGST